MVTRRGLLKTSIMEYENIERETSGINLREEDELIQVKY